MAATKTNKRQTKETAPKAPRKAVRKTAESRARRTTAPVRRSRTVTTPPAEKRHGLRDYFRFGESYTSLILGIVVVIISAILLISFARNSDLISPIDPQQGTSSTATEENMQQDQRTYTVQEGDDLWKIAEAEYNNGYNWVAIAKENDIENPSILPVGTKLVIPNIEKAEATQEQETAAASPTLTQSPSPTQAQQVAEKSQPQQSVTGGQIAGSTYTVAQGDYLWDIAIRAYGDGYRWVDIARVNNITNPDIIYPGTKLTLPRS